MTEAPGKDDGVRASTQTLVVCAATRLLRDGLSDALSQRSRFTVVGSAADYEECLAVVEERSPTVVLVDASLAGAAVAIGALARQPVCPKVIALGVPNTYEDILDCIESGAAAFVTVDESIEDLISAMYGALRGEVVACPPLVSALMSRLSALAAQRKAVEMETLTDRELEIAALLTKGLSNKEIAAELQIELATVKNHVHRVLVKLGVQRRGQVRARLLEPDRALRPTGSR